MFTSGEKRGLIALMVLLTLVLVLVIGRRMFFTPASAEADAGSMTVAIDTLDTTLTNPADTAFNSKSKSGKRKTKKKSVPKPKREPVMRDPLSEPVNN